MPRVSFDRPTAPVIPISLTVALSPDLQGAQLDQAVCDNQQWQGRIGKALSKKLEETGQTRVRAIRVLSADQAPPSDAAPSDYRIDLRMLGQELVGKDRTGSSDQYNARLRVELAARYQKVLADRSTQTLGEGPLRVSDNVSVFTPRVGQAGGRCLTNSLDDALDKAAESLAEQLFTVAAQLPAGGPGGRAQQMDAAAPPPTTAAPIHGQAGVVGVAAAAVTAPPMATPSTTQQAPATAAPRADAAVAQRQPNSSVALVIGLRSYRSPWSVASPASDINTVVRQLQSHAGVPHDRMMVLENELANRLDIDEAISQWLAGHTTRESVVYVYFVGHTTMDTQTGELYLAPYDATLQDPPSRFLPLRRLQSQLSRIPSKVSLILLDTTVTPLKRAAPSKDRAGTSATANWRGDLVASSEPGHPTVLQFARASGDRSGSLLLPLAGSGDIDHDGRITAGELLKTLKPQTVTAPLISGSAPVLDTVLSTAPR
ncbi:MAG: hypothetical protein U0172_12755 [Nitrospiraceae bacterium]